MEEFRERQKEQRKKVPAKNLFCAGNQKIVACGFLLTLVFFLTVCSLTQFEVIMEKVQRTKVSLFKKTIDVRTICIIVMIYEYQTSCVFRALEITVLWRFQLPLYIIVAQVNCIQEKFQCSYKLLVYARKVLSEKASAEGGVWPSIFKLYIRGR